MANTKQRTLTQMGHTIADVATRNVINDLTRQLQKTHGTADMIQTKAGNYTPICVEGNVLQSYTNAKTDAKGNAKYDWQPVDANAVSVATNKSGVRATIRFNMDSKKFEYYDAPANEKYDESYWKPVA